MYIYRLCIYLHMNEQSARNMAAVCDFAYFSNSQNFSETKPWVCCELNVHNNECT